MMMGGTEALRCTWDSDCKSWKCNNAEKWPGYPVCYLGHCECRDVVPPASNTPSARNVEMEG